MLASGPFFKPSYLKFSKSLCQFCCCSASRIGRPHGLALVCRWEENNLEATQESVDCQPGTGHHHHSCSYHCSVIIQHLVTYAFIYAHSLPLLFNACHFLDYSAGRVMAPTAVQVKFIKFSPRRGGGSRESRRHGETS